MTERPFAGKRIEANGLTHYVVDEGSGTPVVLLHGFPDSADMWRHQIPALVDSGFRVIAPDLRGSGDSDRAASDEDYFIFNMVNDVVAIADVLGIERFHFVGHDYGAGTGWMLVTAHPERVERYVAMSVGHPGALVLGGLEQMRRSWYSFLFQFKGLAEEKLMANDWSLMREWLAQHPDPERCIEMLARPDTLPAMLGWYRANMKPDFWGVPLDYPAVTVPVMGIYPSDDDFLTEGVLAGSKDYVAGEWRYEKIDGAGHWVPLERPDEVNALLLDFLKS
ncbi:MAG: alpha/beta hydrolase [Actinomycetota bacterium]